MNWTKRRLSEPSTWFAIVAGLAYAIGFTIDAEAVGSLAAGLATLFGLVFVKESGDERKRSADSAPVGGPGFDGGMRKLPSVRKADSAAESGYNGNR